MIQNRMLKWYGRYLQKYFAVPKNIRLNSTHCFVMKIPNKRELQQIVFHHSSDCDVKTLWMFIKSVPQNHIFFWLLVTLASDNSLHFRKTLLERV